MAVVTVGHHPDLTAETAMKAFQERFAGKYVVYRTKLIGSDFVVKESAWVGVGIKLKQERGKTSFVFNSFIPSALYRALFFGLLTWLILRSRFKAIETEVSSFIESAAEFK